MKSTEINTKEVEVTGLKSHKFDSDSARHPPTALPNSKCIVLPII